MNTHYRDMAVQLLDHYITLALSKAGLKVTSDTHAELEALVDSLIDASVEATIRRLEKLDG